MTGLGLLTQFGLSQRGGAPPGAHRFYRLLVTANNGATYLAVGELELYATELGASQSPNAGTASASSESDASNLAANAFDGNTANDSPNWRTGASPAFPQWVQKAFVAGFGLHHYAIVNSTVTTDAATRAPKAWQLQGSHDGSTWTTIDQRTQRARWSQSERREFKPSDPDVFYRLLVTANNGDTYLGVSEVELYASVGGAAVTSSDCLGTASSESDGSNLAQYAWDGNTGTSWRVVFGSGPHWTQQIFPASLVVSQYGVRNWHDAFGAAARAPKDWKLQRSTDGITWSDLHTVTGETGWAQGELRKFTI